MRIVSFALVAVVLALGATARPDLVARFENFKKTYHRKYTSNAEEAMRLGYFIRNMQKAEELQKLNPLASFGVNEFADLSEEEFSTRHNSAAFYRRAALRKPTAGDEKPASAAVQKIDWRTKGAVTAVKNQGQCGSCWSFSTTGNIEGQWQIAGNALVSLSEQELVSCDTTCSGCNGGLMDDAFEWLVNSRNGGITSEAAYPYVSGAGSVPACDMSGKSSYAYITGHTDIAHSESAMSTWLGANGPLSIGVDATAWQTYQSGIMTTCTSNEVDHGVLAVGFDLTAPTPYWIIKNSWGASWGEEGYIRVAYGSNQCLLTTAPSSSIVSKGPQPPSPPSPPSPPTPPTPPTNGTFTQYTCDSAFCLSGCSATAFPTDTCLPLNGGGSALASCGTSNLHLQVFTTTDCTGSSTTNDIPLNQCVQDTSGTYIYDTCSASTMRHLMHSRITKDTLVKNPQPQK